MITNPQVGQRVAFERTNGLPPVFGTIAGIHEMYNAGYLSITWQEDVEGRHCIHSANHPNLRPALPTDKQTTPRHRLITA